MPALSVEEMLHWGVSPEGEKVVLIVQSATQGPVRLVLGTQTLSDLVIAGQQAKLQAQRNAANQGDDMIIAVPVHAFKVMALAGGKMTLLSIDPGQPTEMVYGFPKPEAAIAAGRALVAEGLNAQRINTALNKAIIPPPGRRIIRPN